MEDVQDSEETENSIVTNDDEKSEEVESENIRRVWYYPIINIRNNCNLLYFFVFFIIIFTKSKM